MRCYTCGKVLADKWVPYINAVQNDKNKEDGEVDQSNQLELRYIDVNNPKPEKSIEGKILDEMELEGISSDGRASIWISGNQTPLRVRIDEELLSEGKEITETAVIEALKNAHEISTITMKERMEELTGGLNLNLPGITDEK